MYLQFRRPHEPYYEGEQNTHEAYTAKLPFIGQDLLPQNRLFLCWQHHPPQYNIIEECAEDPHARHPDLACRELRQRTREVVDQTAEQTVKDEDELTEERHNGRQDAAKQAEHDHKLHDGHDHKVRDERRKGELIEIPREKGQRRELRRDRHREAEAHGPWQMQPVQPALICRREKKQPRRGRERKLKADVEEQKWRPEQHKEPREQQEPPPVALAFKCQRDKGQSPHDGRAQHGWHAAC